MATPMISVGTTIKNVAGSTNTALVTGLNIDDGTLEMIDVTVLSNTTGRREELAGLIGVGSVTVDILFDTADATHVLFVTRMNAGTIDSWLITFTDGASKTLTFYGAVTNVTRAVVLGELTTATVTISMDGVTAPQYS